LIELRVEFLWGDAAKPSAHCEAIVAFDENKGLELPVYVLDLHLCDLARGDRLIEDELDRDDREAFRLKRGTDPLHTFTSDDEAAIAGDENGDVGKARYRCETECNWES
jgi:hypothetical protein